MNVDVLLSELLIKTGIIIKDKGNHNMTKDDIMSWLKS